jgi:hypothetical protein
MSRDRVTFQSQVLYAGSGQSGVHGNADLIPRQLQKVQMVSITSNTNKEPIDEFGRLAALGYTAVTSPLGALRFQYFLGKGENEDALGFNIDGTRNFLNIDSSLDKNFYLLTVGKEKDAIQSGDYTASDRKNHSVTALGNGILTNYTVEGHVGSIPTAIVEWDGANIAFSSGSSGIPNPAVDRRTFCLRSGEVTLGTATSSGIETPVLRAEDISLDFGPALLAEGGPVLPGNIAGPKSRLISSARKTGVSIPLEVAVPNVTSPDLKQKVLLSTAGFGIPDDPEEKAILAPSHSTIAVGILPTCPSTV